MARPTNAEVAQRHRDLNEKQLAFVIWAATPDGIRKPETQQEFCDVIGVNQTTVWRWSKDPRILDAVRFVVLQNAGSPGRVGQVLDMLHKKAIENEDIKSAELWLKGTGVLSQFGRGNSVLDSLDDGVDFSDFSDEEIARLKLEAEASQLEAATIAQAKAMILDAKSDTVIVEVVE